MFHYNQQNVHGRFRFNEKNSGKSKKWNRHELTCIPSTRPHILFRFVSGRAWKIQRSRACKALPGPKSSPIPSDQQPSRISCGYNHPLDWFACRPTETQRLRTVDDQQHDSRRMDAKIKLQQSWQRPRPSHSPCRRSSPPHPFIYGRRNKRIQSVVHGEIKQRCRCILSGLAPGQQRTHLNTPSPLPTTDADALQNISAAQRDQLLADFATAAITREQAVTGGTHDNKSCAWARWEEYCLSIGCQDIFMDSLSKQEQILLLGAFAMAVRSGRFSDLQFNTLVEGTVRGTISNVVQTFQSTGRQNPTKDADDKLSILLSRQFWAFRNEDSKEKQQKALPFAVLDELAKRLVTETDKSSSNSPLVQPFLLAGPVNIQKFHKENRNAWNSCSSETSASSEMDVSCPHNPTIWNPRIVSLLHSRCRKMIWSMTLSFMAGQTTLFCAQYYNGTSCEQNLDISRCITGYSGVYSLEKWSRGTHHLQKYPSALAIGLQLIRKRLPWLWTSQNRHPLVAIRSSNGDVSWGNPSLHHHAHRQVVEQRISLLHSKTGGTILAQRCKEDADLSVIPSHPGHRSLKYFFRRPRAAQPS